MIPSPCWKWAAAALLLWAALGAQAQPHFNGAKAYAYAREFVAIGPRWPTSPGHAKAEEFLRSQFKHDQLEEDAFTANTPIGAVAMRNFIVRFPGKKDGIIVLATHYAVSYTHLDVYKRQQWMRPPLARTSIQDQKEPSTGLLQPIHT